MTQNTGAAKNAVVDGPDRSRLWEGMVKGGTNGEGQAEKVTPFNGNKSKNPQNIFSLLNNLVTTR